MEHGTPTERWNNGGATEHHRNTETRNTHGKTEQHRNNGTPSEQRNTARTMETPRNSGALRWSTGAITEH